MGSLNFFFTAEVFLNADSNLNAALRLIRQRINLLENKIYYGNKTDTNLRHCIHSNNFYSE